MIEENWKEKLLEIKELNIKGTPLKEAIKIHNWTLNKYRSLHSKLSLPRVKGRLYKTNLDYFKNIDTERKAYFLGFIYADGCIHSPKSNRSSKVFGIKLQQQDSYILEELAKDISPNRKPILKSELCSFNNKISNMVYYRVNSDEIYNDLYKHGIRERKSKGNLVWPILNQDLYRHFIRGFLDGDGWISLRLERNTACVGFCSTDNSFLLKIASLFNFKWCNCIKSNRGNNSLIVYNLSTESRKNVLFLKDYLYKDSSIYLIRKFNKFNMLTAS